MATNQDLTFIKGDTVTLRVTVSDAGGSPVDLTTPVATVRMTAKLNKTDDDINAAISAIANNNHISADPANGVTVFELLSTATGSTVGTIDGTDITEGKYSYDIQYATDGPPVGIYTFIKGTLTVDAEITKTNSAA